jgi:hypothetical protein
MERVRSFSANHGTTSYHRNQNVKITLDLNARQIAALRRQLAEPDIAMSTAKRKPTEHRRRYMADFMRKRRAAAKAA